MLTDYVSDIEEFKFSEMVEQEKQAYEPFKQFHQQYIDSDGKPAKLSDIIHSIMDRA